MTTLIPIPPEYQERASEVFAVLDALEQGKPPANWIEQIDQLGVGDEGKRWMFSRCLGAKGCEVRSSAEQITFEAEMTPLCTYYVSGHERKARRFRIPSKARYNDSADYYIVCALQTAARIAFVHKKDKALEMCLDALVEQVKTPTVSSVLKLGN